VALQSDELGCIDDVGMTRPRKRHRHRGRATSSCARGGLPAAVCARQLFRHPLSRGDPRPLSLPRAQRPHLAEADVRAPKRGSGYDPSRKLSVHRSGLRFNCYGGNSNAV
jgi:hypothetical protein